MSLCCRIQKKGSQPITVLPFFIKVFLMRLRIAQIYPRAFSSSRFLCSTGSVYPLGWVQPCKISSLAVLDDEQHLIGIVHLLSLLQAGIA